jgi:hypothetical protein
VFVAGMIAAALNVPPWTSSAGAAQTPAETCCAVMCRARRVTVRVLRAHRQRDHEARAGKESVPLELGHITRDRYATFAAKHGVADLPKPPAEEISVSEAFAIDAGNRDQQINQRGGDAIPRWPPRTRS